MKQLHDPYSNFAESKTLRIKSQPRSRAAQAQYWGFFLVGCLDEIPLANAITKHDNLRRPTTKSPKQTWIDKFCYAIFKVTLLESLKRILLLYFNRIFTDCRMLYEGKRSRRTGIPSTC